MGQRFLLLLLVNDVDDNLWDGSYNVIFETNNNNNNDAILGSITSTISCKIMIRKFKFVSEEN